MELLFAIKQESLFKGTVVEVRLQEFLGDDVTEPELNRVDEVLVVLQFFMSFNPFLESFLEIYSKLLWYSRHTSNTPIYPLW